MQIVLNVERSEIIHALDEAGSAAAGPFKDGYAAANRQDYATALRLWTPMAEQGNASAQYNLGIMYANGQGVPKDYVLAAKWL
jgi:TPR repeat protein